MSLKPKKEIVYQPRNPDTYFKKSQTVNLRTSPDENELLRQAAEKLSQQTGEKENISKTIIQAVKQFNEQEPYYFNRSRYEQCLTANKFAFNHYSEICKSYKRLGIGDMSIELLGTLEYTGEDNIKQQFFATVEKNLDRLGITTQSLRDFQMAGCEAPLTEFLKTLNLRRELLQRTRQSYQGLPIEAHHFSVDNGELRFTDEDKEKIKEFFSIRLDTPAKRDLVDLVNEFISIHKQIKETLIKNKCPHVWGPWNALNLTADNEIIFNKEILNQIKL